MARKHEVLNGQTWRVKISGKVVDAQVVSGAGSDRIILRNTSTGRQVQKTARGLRRLVRQRPKEMDEPIRERLAATGCCDAPDVDEPEIPCGHPLPCPRHQAEVTPCQLVKRSTGGAHQDHKLTSFWSVSHGRRKQLRMKVEVRIDASFAVQSKAAAAIWNENELAWSNVSSVRPHEDGWPENVSYNETDVTALLMVESELVKRALWALGIGAL